jgi:hypothetical protein
VCGSSEASQYIAGVVLSIINSGEHWDELVERQKFTDGEITPARATKTVQRYPAIQLTNSQNGLNRSRSNYSKHFLECA